MRVVRNHRKEARWTQEEPATPLTWSDALQVQMDLALNIAVGSSIQVALFVAPVLVFSSMLMGHPHPLDLHFTMMEVVVIAVGVLALVG